VVVDWFNTSRNTLIKLYTRTEDIWCVHRSSTWTVGRYKLAPSARLPPNRFYMVSRPSPATRRAALLWTDWRQSMWYAWCSDGVSGPVAAAVADSLITRCRATYTTDSWNLCGQGQSKTTAKFLASLMTVTQFKTTAPWKFIKLHALQVKIPQMVGNRPSARWTECLHLRFISHRSYAYLVSAERRLDFVRSMATKRTMPA